MENIMTIDIFGYLLAVADTSLILFAYLLLYRAVKSRDDEAASIDYLGSLQASDTLTRTPSNMPGQPWHETRRTA